MKTLLTTAAILAAATTAHADNTKHFDGLYLGAEAGYIHDDNDVNGPYGGAFAGYRIQTNDDIVYGLEGTFGKPDISPYGSDFMHLWTVVGSVGIATGNDKRNLWSIGAGYAQIKIDDYYANSANAEAVGFIGYERAFGSAFSLSLRLKTYEFESAQATIGLGLRF